MSGALLHVAHHLSRIISDEALDVTMRGAVITMAVVSVYWYSRIQVSTIPQGWKRWLFYVMMLARLACVFPEVVSLAFLAEWCGDQMARKERQAKIMEAARAISSMDPSDPAAFNAAVNKYAEKLSD
jgi:hypothetical protein